MDVDRIAAMGGVGQEQSPLWTRNKTRRRKFSEEVEPSMAEQEEAEAAAAGYPNEEHDGVLDLMA
jgi:hypothetical protein